MSNQNAQEKIYLAKETLEKYKNEYDHLVNVERPSVQAALKEARAQGDLSENAEYDAARDRQGTIEGRISELEAILDRAEIISTTLDGKIGIGSTITYFSELDKEKHKVTIMGSHDANPFENKISNESPLAVAMLDAKKGDKIEVDAPVKYFIEILDIVTR
ncbi:transcription elongation factor GreA [Mycoplasmopsis alligatoris]|uniref:Transcription elongation factor GreA n=1 Tax=Mycoplasmopsis alligatoris A21JP2 TaxID=747682 RepID=D4XWZ1_9BACT|nr:transcription elongation factor GreA [Mycoplasmopsis alligatoris]EFF41278.1 putative transcription elongation factor GreA [Mycoplasmopsis alligatoris A21JP2]